MVRRPHLQIAIGVQIDVPLRHGKRRAGQPEVVDAVGQAIVWLGRAVAVHLPFHGDVKRIGKLEATLAIHTFVQDRVGLRVGRRIEIAHKDDRFLLGHGAETLQRQRRRELLARRVVVKVRARHDERAICPFVLQPRPVDQPRKLAAAGKSI